MRHFGCGATMFRSHWTKCTNIFNVRRLTSNLLHFLLFCFLFGYRRSIISNIYFHTSKIRRTKLANTIWTPRPVCIIYLLCANVMRTLGVCRACKPKNMRITRVLAISIFMRCANTVCILIFRKTQFLWVGIWMGKIRAKRQWECERWRDRMVQQKEMLDS